MFCYILSFLIIFIITTQPPAHSGQIPGPPSNLKFGLNPHKQRRARYKGWLQPAGKLLLAARGWILPGGGGWSGLIKSGSTAGGCATKRLYKKMLYNEVDESVFIVLKDSYTIFTPFTRFAFFWRSAPRSWNILYFFSFDVILFLRTISPPQIAFRTIFIHANWFPLCLKPMGGLSQMVTDLTIPYLILKSDPCQ